MRPISIRRNVGISGYSVNRYEIVRVTGPNIEVPNYGIKKSYLYFWSRYLWLNSIEDDNLSWLFSRNKYFKSYCLTNSKDYVFSVYTSLLKRKKEKLVLEFETLTSLESLCGEK